MPGWSLWYVDRTFAIWATDCIDASHACCECGSKWNFPPVCIACWQNSYKETESNSSELCETCSFGNYTSVVGSETCSTCDAGYDTTEITPTLTCGAEPDKRVEAHCASTCTPSSGATSGIISDGAGTYPDFQACWWLLSASPGVEISISFESISLEEEYDLSLIHI